MDCPFVAMLNLADMSSLFTVLIFAFATPSAANVAGGPLWLVIILIPIGIGVGILGALLNHRMMYRFLGVKLPHEEKSEGNFLFYMLWPFFWWITSSAIATALGKFLTHLIRG
jgi:hypothetical protein